MRRKHHLTMLKGRFKEVDLCGRDITAHQTLPMLTCTLSACTLAEAKWMMSLLDEGCKSQWQNCGSCMWKGGSQQFEVTWLNDMKDITLDSHRSTWTSWERGMNLNHWDSYLFWLLFFTRAYHHLCALIDCLSFLKQKQKHRSVSICCVPITCKEI